nr:hypothetical protein [Actinomycetota bacterium]
HGVSLRDVSAAAGQRNHSAAQYHFGDRSGVIGGVFSNRMAEVDRRRRELLDAAPAVSDDVKGPIEVLVRPLADMVVASDGWYARFLARARWDPVSLEIIGAQPEAYSYHAARARLADALAALPPKIRASRLDQIDHVAVCTLAGWEWSRDRGEERLDAEVMIDEIIATSVAIACVPPPRAVTDLQASPAT